LGLEGFDGIFFEGFCFREPLIIVEVDKVGGSIILGSLSAFGAVPGEVSYFSTLKTGVRLISCGGRVALEVILLTVPLIAIGILSSAEVIAPIVSSIVPAGWRFVPVYIHGDRSVIHPSWSV